MDDRQFDDLLRNSTNGETRRGLLRALGSGTLAAVLGRFGLADADAKPRRRRCRRRPKLGQRCKFRHGVTCRCRFGAKCIGGHCRCPHGTFEIHGVCIPPPDTCLAHGALCDGSDSCCSGFCTYEGPLDEVEPTCCVPNAETCAQASDCCADADDPARCQHGRCCRGEGGLCADPTGHQFDVCCTGLVCDVGDTDRCVELGVATP